MTGYLAQINRGAAVVLEHRFFGMSNPYNDLSEASLAVLTVDQAIADIVYFANNVQLPMPHGDKAGPYDLPWVLIGGEPRFSLPHGRSLTIPHLPGSYPGALTTWTMNRY